MSADPIELIHILYEHTLDLVENARRYLAAGDVPARGKAISRAIDAVSELEASLDHQLGGSISRNLGELYRYMRGRLLEANIQQKDGPLAEVESLLRTLDEGWSSIRPAAQRAIVTPAMPVAAATSAWGGAFTPEPEAEYAGQGWSA